MSRRNGKLQSTSHAPVSEFIFENLMIPELKRNGMQGEVNPQPINKHSE